jgi:RNA polymerase sigma factor (TIGR02999 family)
VPQSSSDNLPFRPDSTLGGGETDSVVAAVYQELHALAAVHMARERAGHTLQPTALVHEVYLRLAAEGTDWVNRAQFLCVAARQIRRVLVDHARARKAKKRGGDLVRVTLSDVTAGEKTFDLLELNRALEKLDANSPRDREIVELKYFAGLRETEIAEMLGIGVRTVRRRWGFARAWLFRELRAGDDG